VVSLRCPGSLPPLLSSSWLIMIVVVVVVVVVVEVEVEIEIVYSRDGIIVNCM
jgi:hypothetical protein